MQVCYQQYLQVRGIHWPANVANAVAATLHPLVGYLFTQRLGLAEVGVGVATSTAFVASFATLQVLLKTRGVVCTLPGWSGLGSDLGRFAQKTWPSLAKMLLTVGVYPATVGLASSLEPQAFVVFLALWSVEALLFTIPLGLSVALARIVKKQTTKGNTEDAKTYTLAAACLVVAVLVPLIVLVNATAPLWAQALSNVGVT